MIYPSDFDNHFLGDFRDQETSAEKTDGHTAVLAGEDYEQLHIEFYAKANAEQNAFFEKIKNAIICRKKERNTKKPISKADSHITRFYFLTGDGVVGKTFLYNVIRIQSDKN